MKLPAGIVDHDVEFFQHKDQLMVLYNGKSYSFERMPAAVKYYLEDILDGDPDAQLCLECMDIRDHMAQLKQFAFCRYSSFDLVADITQGGYEHPEFTLCDKRGKCPFEGTLCRSLKSYCNLSSRELQVIRSMASGLPNKLMADELDISVNTVSTHIQNIANKIGAVVV